MPVTLLDEHLRSLRIPTMFVNYDRVAKHDVAKIGYLEGIAVMRQQNAVKTARDRALLLRAFRSLKESNHSTSL